MRISRDLTGMTDLDPSIGRTIFTLLGMDGRIGILGGRSAGKAGPAAGRQDLEVEIISAWFSGIVETDKGPRLATYSDALMWRALDFTKPFGECSDGFGSWAAKPKA